MSAPASSDLFVTPKPSRLIKRVLQIASDKDSIILDSFAGSGTTAHAVLALNEEDGGNRKFILVECEEYADSVTAERVRRVINGVPDASDESLREGLGGSFLYHTLGESITTEDLLTGSVLPTFPALAAYLLYTATGVAADSSELNPHDDDGLFYCDDNANYYLLYKPNLEFLRSNAAMLGEQQAKRISEESREQERKAVVFGAGKYIGQRDLTSMGITFCQLPYELHHSG